MSNNFELKVEQTAKQSAISECAEPFWGVTDSSELRLNLGAVECPWLFWVYVVQSVSPAI